MRSGTNDAGACLQPLRSFKVEPASRLPTRRPALSPLASNQHTDTLLADPCPSQVKAYTGADELAAALKGCELVVIPAGVPRKPGMTRDDLFNINAGT